MFFGKERNNAFSCAHNVCSCLFLYGSYTSPMVVVAVFFFVWVRFALLCFSNEFRQKVCTQFLVFTKKVKPADRPFDQMNKRASKLASDQDKQRIVRRIYKINRDVYALCTAHTKRRKICAHGNANGNVIVLTTCIYVEKMTKFEYGKRSGHARARSHSHTHNLKTKNYFNYYNCNQNLVIKLHKCLARTYFFFKFTENKIYFTNYIRKKWTIILFFICVPLFSWYVCGWRSNWKWNIEKS